MTGFFFSVREIKSRHEDARQNFVDNLVGFSMEKSLGSLISSYSRLLSGLFEQKKVCDV